MRKATDQRDAQIISLLWTSLLPFHGGDVLCFEVKCLMSWCLLVGQVMWWSRHLMRCDGLCRVMSRDAMQCHGDELYYSSTTLYYKVLLQYYPELQSTTHYSSTTLYYKVLLQYYSVLQRLVCILQNYPVLQSTTQVVLCTTKYYSNTTPY